MSVNIYQLLFCFSLLELSAGFTCYKCSYAIQTENSRRECIESPEMLGFGARLNCNETSFCVLSEQYDIHKKMVTSYFRSCSGKSWGNECHKDWSHVTCYASCQGNYCNSLSKGHLYKEYLRTHTDIPGYSNGPPIHHGVNMFLFCICVYLGLCPY